MRRIAAATLVLSGLTFAGQPLQPSDDVQLRKTAIELSQAIAQENIALFLRHVSRSKGLGCTDRRISYQRVGKDLEDKNSHLYLSLFDSRRFADKCGKEYPAEFPAISDKEFFSTSATRTIDTSSVGNGAAQVVFRSSVQAHYPREWLFHKERDGWKVIDGFVVGRCSCG